LGDVCPQLTAASVFEDYPEDESKVDVENPDIALKIATTLKDVGTAEFKAGNFVIALAKYQKATRYLDNATPSAALAEAFTKTYVTLPQLPHCLY
jgi:hypothetical protein